MRRSEHSFLTPSLLEIVEPDKEDEFEGNGHSRGDSRPLIEKNDCDFVLLHIEGTDEVSHDRDLWSKVTALEKADDMLGYIMGEIEGREILLVVLSDHTTSTELGDHTADPAPIVLWNGKFVPDLVSKFTEQEIYSGGLHRIFGKDIIPLILDQTDRAHKFGA